MSPVEGGRGLVYGFHLLRMMILRLVDLMSEMTCLMLVLVSGGMLSTLQLSFMEEHPFLFNRRNGNMLVWCTLRSVV